MKSFLIAIILLSLCTLSFAVPFTLHNKSLVSIPLVIPSVMNPNLSPKSDSGVDLAVGQEIFFWAPKKNGKGKAKYLLLKVTEDLAGKSLDVVELIRQRKAELFGQ